MGIIERKERERTERKALIMRCAKELILEYGVDAVSMGDIAEKAELSKATLYLYFPSKEDLFREIYDEAGNRFIEYFQSRLSPGLSALESLKLFWNCYLNMYGSSNDVIIVFNMKNYIAPAFPFISIEDTAEDTAQSEDPPRSPSDFSCMLYSMLKQMIDQGIAEGTFDPAINPGISARTILSLFSYIVENVAKMPKTARKSQVIIEEMKYIFEILLRGIVREGFDRSRLVLPGIVS
ncbi:MAG: TetR/AcrR family transcriptional regulator; helix-turn-helix transcriptional regulator [Treponema sp.]|nr:TetR/AcrR family transcriptional regulator; helix-turn-helix transcriptional regulator [Treponema sp.]